MITLFVMNQKGFHVLKKIHENYPHQIQRVISSRDENVQSDFYDDIFRFCHNHKIEFHSQKKFDGEWSYALAVGWRWMISNTKNLIVIHDSLLPKYRGFNPLVSALLNGDDKIGATALWAGEKADEGDVIIQKSIEIQYPIKIMRATDLMCEIYGDLSLHVVELINEGIPIPRTPQDSQLVTYSMWRDEEDYCIDWNKSSIEIRRAIDSLGFPYKGASSQLDGDLVRIVNGSEVPDLKIINRTPGKVFSLENGCPIVACGSGLIKLTEVVSEQTKRIINFKKLKSRFK